MIRAERATRMTKRFPVNYRYGALNAPLIFRFRDYARKFINRGGEEESRFKRKKRTILPRFFHDSSTILPRFFDDRNKVFVSTAFRDRGDAIFFTFTNMTREIYRKDSSIDSRTVQPITPGTSRLESGRGRSAGKDTREAHLDRRRVGQRREESRREDTITVGLPYPRGGRAGQVTTTTTTTRIVARDTTMLSIFRFSSTLTVSLGWHRTGV